MKNWSKIKVVLQESRTVLRHQPMNFEILPPQLKTIFNNIRHQDCPPLYLEQGSNVSINDDGVIYDSRERAHLSHHEYSELRVVRHRLNMSPCADDFIDNPRKALGRYWRYLHAKKYEKDIEYLCPNSTYLYFSDSRAQSNFFHWFADALVRLLVSNCYTRDSKILLTKKQLRYKYVLESLRLLKIDESRIFFMEEGRTYFAKNIQVVSTAIYATGACSPDGIKILRGLISRPSQEPNEKIYLARKSALGRGIENDIEFRATLEFYGIRIIYPENYSLDELILLLGKTKILIGVYGAALTHVIFLPKNSSLIELAITNYISEKPSYWRGKYSAKYSGDYYYSLADASEVNYNVVPCRQVDEKLDLLNSKIFVNLQALSETIEMALS